VTRRSGGVQSPRTWPLDTRRRRDRPISGQQATRRPTPTGSSGGPHLLHGVVEQVRSNGIVTMVGASGSGKSSFLRAGLLPALDSADHLLFNLKDCSVLEASRSPSSATRCLRTRLRRGNRGDRARSPDRRLASPFRTGSRTSGTTYGPTGGSAKPQQSGGTSPGTRTHCTDAHGSPRLGNGQGETATSVR
jgi:hypothetical protein